MGHRLNRFPSIQYAESEHKAPYALKIGPNFEEKKNSCL